MTQLLDRRAVRRLARNLDAGMGNEYFYGPFLSGAIAGRDDAAARLIMTVALDDGVKPLTLEEIILQSHLFLGFPAMIETARIFADVCDNHGRSDGLPGAYSEKDCRDWNRLGTAKIKRLYGPAFARLVRYINSFSPQILTWMINDGYGQVLSRPGASFQLRELSVVATLTVTGYENQLGAHIRGALNVGVGSSLIKKTMRNCRFFCPDDNIREAIHLLDQAVTA
jgi:alkylhydroperoxidase/carboxymuconolactone decarboxylase family protein YurZ